MLEKSVKIKFVFGKENKVVDAKIGDTILEVAEKNNIPLHGACEGNCACGTCHVVIDENNFNKLQEKKECEEDTLDMVPGLTHFSRLGCQVRITKDLENMVIVIPEQNRNFV
jgi:2Fe-2S ferredoxin